MSNKWSNNKATKGKTNIQKIVRERMANVQGGPKYDSLTKKEQDEACFVATCQIAHTLSEAANILNASSMHGVGRQSTKYTEAAVLAHQSDLEMQGIRTDRLGRKSECDWDIIRMVSSMNFSDLREKLEIS